MTTSPTANAIGPRRRAVIGSLIGSLVGFGGFAALTFGVGWTSMYPMMLVGIGAGFGAARAARSSEVMVAIIAVVTGVAVAVVALAALGGLAGLNPFFEEVTPEAAEAIAAAPLGVPPVHLLFAGAVTAIAAVLSVVAMRMVRLPDDG